MSFLHSHNTLDPDKTYTVGWLSKV